MTLSCRGTVHTHKRDPNALDTMTRALELLEVEYGYDPFTLHDFWQVLLRGCMLRNTDHVYGIVIFTGHESKVSVPVGFEVFAQCCRRLTPHLTLLHPPHDPAP